MRTLLLILFLAVVGVSRGGITTSPGGGGTGGGGSGIAVATGTGTNTTLLTPRFYGKVGIGIATPFTAVELRDGSSDQAILLTREANTSYTSLGFRTGASYDWQIGQRNGDSTLYFLNAQTGAYLRESVNGRLDIYCSAGSFVDNGLNVVNLSGGFAAGAFYRPADGVGAVAGAVGGAAVAIGFGPGQLGGANTPYTSRAYIGLSPSNGIGLPPEFIIAQEQTNSVGAYLTHIRQHILNDGTIRFYSYHDTLQTGAVAMAISPAGLVGVGTATPATVLDVPGTTSVGTLLATNNQTPTIVVSGAGNGNTNYTLIAGKSVIGGSSNVNIVASMGGVAGLRGNAQVTFSNLSAITWGFGVSSITNSWHWAGPNGTNPPTTIPAGFELNLAIEARGVSNLIVGWATNAACMTQ